MASNIFPRWKGAENLNASIYETIRQHDQDEESDESDLEGQDGLAEPYDVEGQRRPAASRGAFSQISFSSPPRSRQPVSPQRTRTVRPKWASRGQRLPDVEDVEDDVPASLLIEGEQVGERRSITLPAPPSSMATHAPRLDTISSPEDQNLSSRQEQGAPNTQSRLAAAVSPLAAVDSREKAMWRWTNVVNLDNFLGDVYSYYIHHGMWSILLRRVFGLLTSAFLVGFSLFLTQCINYHSGLGHVDKLEQVLVKKCVRKMSFFPSLLLWSLTLIWICKAFQYVMDVARLRQLHDFYFYLLDVSDAELQSISWQEIVSRLMALRDSNPMVAQTTSAKSRRYVFTQSKQRMDAHDIANRLMRRENYTIAMINKDILDMTLPIPFLRNRQLFTRTLEWNLNWCVMDFVFNDRGQVRQIFLKDNHRKELSDALRKRFVFAGTANLIIAPFLILFFLIQNFFTHFNEYQKNPGAIGSREYNVLAEWKFREFNELWHLFKRRINMSHPFASRYIDQFPKDKTIQAARFVTFISGALISVLGMATIFDQENFLALELTPGRTAIFYLGVCGGIWAVARGMIPDDSLVYEPAFAMQEVIDFTHYQPNHWQDRLHTVEVKKEFEQLYQMKIFMFVEEILSMVFTPFVLWFSLPKCSDRIIDFFREFTVHVDGIGYVCSFAEFKMKKPSDDHADPIQERQLNGHGAPSQDARHDYFASKDHKLEQSYWGFMNDYSRNPKADVRFLYQNARRRVNLPPPVPGLPSPTLHAGFGNNSTTTRPGSIFSPPRLAQAPSSASLFVPQSVGSPLQSMLLDPHHQPAPEPAKARKNIRSMHISQAITKGLQRGFEYPANVAEEKDDEVEAVRTVKTNDPPSISQSGSWKYDDERADSSPDEDENHIPSEGVGVLGLIRRLQKTQSEGDRASAGI